MQTIVCRCVSQFSQTDVCAPTLGVLLVESSARRSLDEPAGSGGCTCNHRRMTQISISHSPDPACPFAYSASPALAVLQWRYDDQLDWRLVTIGLSENPERYLELGYTPTRMTIGNIGFRRYGMPFAYEPRPRVTAS